MKQSQAENAYKDQNEPFLFSHLDYTGLPGLCVSMLPEAVKAAPKVTVTQWYSTQKGGESRKLLPSIIILA